MMNTPKIDIVQYIYYSLAWNAREDNDLHNLPSPRDGKKKCVEFELKKRKTD